jgi:hypothetical protein
MERAFVVPTLRVMTIEALAAPPRRWLAPQVLLGFAGVVACLFALISLNTVYEGLPAHPLLVHVPVILIPTTALGGLLLLWKPHWFERHAVWLCGLTALTLAALNLTVNAGGNLRNDLGLYGNSAVDDLVARHAAAAGKLQFCFIVYTAAFIVVVALYRHQRGELTGIGWIDAIVGAVLKLFRGLTIPRVILGLLALGSLYLVFLTGDLGARAVWQGRVQTAALQGGAGIGAAKPSKP